MTRRNMFSALGALFAGTILPRLNQRPWNSTHHAVVTSKSAIGMNVMLTDKWRNMIPLAFEWNMDTETAGLFISVKSTIKSDTSQQNRIAVTGRTMAKGEIARVFAHLPGCKLRWRGDLKVVTREEVLAGKRLS